MAADPDWQDRVIEAPHVIRVEALGEYGVTLKVEGTVRAEERWAAPGEFRKRLLAAFREHGIEIPRPQRVVLAVRSGRALGGDPSDPGRARAGWGRDPGRDGPSAATRRAEADRRPSDPAASRPRRMQRSTGRRHP